MDFQVQTAMTNSMLTKVASEHKKRESQSTNMTYIRPSIYSSWRASVASETVLGVDNAKSGICYMYICMWDGTYAP